MDVKLFGYFSRVYNQFRIKKILVIIKISSKMIYDEKFVRHRLD